MLVALIDFCIRRSTMNHSSTSLFIGLDVHKESIAVAYAPEVSGAEVISFGTR